MDKLIYTAMTGAKHSMEQQATVSHNLSNATTTGYRAEISAFRAVPILGESPPTRTFVVDSTPGADFSPGAIQHTGRDLDVAVQGKGWIALQLEDGSEAYTRNGSLQVSSNGILQSRNGVNVQGDGGQISIPPDNTIIIAKDGTVSVISPEQRTSSTVGRIKLVNPPEENMVRGDDGLFRLRDSGEAEADANVTLIGGALEGSNVNVVEAMVNMITLARTFELQMRMLHEAGVNAQQATQLLAVKT